jgi:hypothetical protein
MTTSTTTSTDTSTETLTEYVLGLLPPHDAAALDERCAHEPALARAADELRALLAEFAATLPGTPPAPTGRTRLLATLASPERFAPFLARLTDLLRLSGDKIRAVLARIDDEASWEKGLPGIDSFHFDAGPALGAADAGLLRFEPGAAFPRHRHKVGHELTFVLEGELYDGGQRFGPGALIDHAPDTVHACAAAPDARTVTLVVHYGIEPVFSD